MGTEFDAGKDLQAKGALRGRSGAADPERDTPQAAARAQSAEMNIVVQPDSGRSQLGPAATRQAAAEGVSGGATRLPHSERIQAAFGHHDVSGVQAHVGGGAAHANRAIGSEAYATGGQVAFKSSPDLHTAAHEVAHVVQQRGGVALKSGLSSPGDTYERHADQVADAVVSGQSAEALLDRHAGSGNGPAAGEAVQGLGGDVGGGGGGSGKKGGFISDLFARIDLNRDKGIDREEVIAHLRRCGISGGFLGLVHSRAADAFLEHLDTNKNEVVTFAEFKSVATKVLPSDVFDEGGNVKPELVDEVYERLDSNRDGQITGEEMKSGVAKELPEDTSHKDTKADVASKLALDALDLDKSGGISKAELLKAAEDAAKLLRQ